MIIDSRNWGTHDGFTIVAHLEGDTDTTLEDFEGYLEDPAVVKGWESDEWHFVVVVVTASRLGVVLGTARLGGEYLGYFTSTAEDGTTTDSWLNPLDEREAYADQIDEAVSEARAKIENLAATIEH